MKKKFVLLTLTTLLAVVSVCVIFADAAVMQYRDVSIWAVTELDKAAEYGLITDKIKDDMSAPITREEFAELAVRLYEKSTGTQAVSADIGTFADTKNKEVLKAFHLGIVNGTDMRRRLFLPRMSANREQVATMVYRAVKAIKPDEDFSAYTAVKFSDEKLISGWALEPVRFMGGKGFIKGYRGEFYPKGECTREMAVIIAKRVYEKYSSANSESASQNSDISNVGDISDLNLRQIVLNDFEYYSNDYRVKEKDGSTYIFINSEKLEFGLKSPYAGNYTYPDLEVDGEQVTISWKDEKGIVLQIIMKMGSTEALVNGRKKDIGMAPFEESGKTFIPINQFIDVLEMGMEADINRNILFIQYKDDFPQDILEGHWSDTDINLFADIEDIIEGRIPISSFATSYQFNKDGKYMLRMISVGGINDTFIIQTGKYRIMGSTIMFYDTIETLYKGNPFTLVYENKFIERPHYEFIEDYNTQENRLEMGVLWLYKRKY